MTPSRAKKVELVRRRQLVADLYIQGTLQVDIAQQMGVTQPTVARDLQAIQKDWRESSVRDFDTARGIELKKLDRLERESWSAFKKSQQPVEATKVVHDGDAKRAEKTVRQQVGDPRFLEQIHKCIASRRAILGLDSPTRIAPTSPDGEEAYHIHVMSKLMQLAEQADSPVVIDAEYVERAATEPQLISGDVNTEQLLAVSMESPADNGQQ